MLKLCFFVVLVAEIVHGLPTDKNQDKSSVVPPINLDNFHPQTSESEGSLLKVKATTDDSDKDDETLKNADSKDKDLEGSETFWGIGFGRPYYGRYYGGWGGYGGYGGFGGYGGWGGGYYGGWRRPYYNNYWSYW